MIWPVTAMLLLASTPAPAAPSPARGCLRPDTFSPGQRMPRPAFKGWELYSWRKPDGAILYSLLVGTNRTKAKDEIENPACSLKDMSEVKATLAHLAKGEWVTWMTWMSPADAMPPPDAIKALTLAAHELQIELHIPESYSKPEN
jgi:hypothetical protein